MMKNNNVSGQEHHSHGRADYVGIAGSVLCLVHCLVTPALALGSTFTVNSHAAPGLDYLFILVNGLAVYFATREHKVLPLSLVLWGASGLFAVSLLLEDTVPVFRLGGYLGSVLLIGGHVYNLIYCKPWALGKQ